MFKEAYWTQTHYLALSRLKGQNYGVVIVSRSGSRSVVPTAAVLAAELIKRTTPPSVVGVPKCRKKL